MVRFKGCISAFVVIASLGSLAVEAAPRKRPVARAAARPAPRLNDTQLLLGALSLNSIKPGADVYAACRRADFKTLALVLAKIKDKIIVEKGEFETDAEFGVRRAQAESVMNSMGDILVCQPLNDNEDAPFDYDANVERFSGKFNFYQNVWRDNKALGSYVSSTAMGAKARVQASLELEYNVTYTDASSWERSRCLTGSYDKRYTVRIPRTEAPLVKARGYMFVTGKLVWPIVAESQQTGSPTLTNPYDVYNRTVTLSIRPETIGIVGPDGRKYFECQPGMSAAAIASRSDTGARLQAALARLGRNPRDVDALIEAGGASLAANDLDVATGFFQRAEQLSPGAPGAIAGLAATWARGGRPREAIAAFERLAASGPINPLFLADKGLAYDLIGENGLAQRAYRDAMAGADSDGVALRLAVSLAISGNKDEPASLLAAGVSRGDPAAVRAQAFVLAIQGKGDEADSIVKAALPPELAVAISAYLRYFPRLTRIQQAAAANLGAFPRPAEIGRDALLPPSYGAGPKRGGLSATSDIAAPLRAAAGAGSQNLTAGSDEEFRSLFNAWVALDR